MRSSQRIYVVFQSNCCVSPIYRSTHPIILSSIHGGSVYPIFLIPLSLSLTLRGSFVFQEPSHQTKGTKQSGCRTFWTWFNSFFSAKDHKPYLHWKHFIRFRSEGNNSQIFPTMPQIMEKIPREISGKHGKENYKWQNHFIIPHWKRRNKKHEYCPWMLKGVGNGWSSTSHPSDYMWGWKCRRNKSNVHQFDICNCM